MCFSFINYLEYCTVLYKVDRYIDDQNSSFVKSRLRVNTNEHERQLFYRNTRRSRIVISDMDTINTCDRPLVKLLRLYCCEWGCHSPMFKKFQVRSISTLKNPKGMITTLERLLK
jgi:hypothetical protein